MHEHSFIEAIISPIENKSDVVKVELEVGELAGISSEHLKEHLVEKTGWDVETNGVDSRVRCECGFEGRAKIRERLHDMVIFECPECGEIPIVLNGDKIKIVKVVYR